MSKRYEDMLALFKFDYNFALASLIVRNMASWTNVKMKVQMGTSWMNHLSHTHGHLKSWFRLKRQTQTVAMHATASHLPSRIPLHLLCSACSPSPCLPAFLPASLPACPALPCPACDSTFGNFSRHLQLPVPLIALIA